MRYHSRYQTRVHARNDKGLPKKAFEINTSIWLPDLDSNQGPAD